MRQFFISFMAALAGFWFSFFLAIVGFFMFIGIVAATSGTSMTTPSKDIEKHSVLTFDLGSSISERRTSGDEFAALIDDASAASTPLNTLIAAIRHAATDKDIDGIVLQCNGISGGMAQMEAILRELKEFKSSGKWIYSYADNYNQADYYLASVSDSIFVNPVGMIDIHGLSSTTLFYKEFLDKIGVNVQVVKVGTFKSAVEPFLLNNISEANKLQQEVYLNQMWGNISGSMAEGRGITTADVNMIADSSCYAKPAEYYLKHKLVDRTLYRHEFDKLLAKVTGQDEVRSTSIKNYIAARNIKPFDSKGSKKIAILYAVGDITEDGSDGIVSSTLVPQILDLAEEDDIAGLIMRVNSGGGSAYASEQIWEALKQYKEKTGNPFYVSMSDYAASGGYYISCGADSIYAEPLTLTGSIGIFGMIPSAQNLLNEKLGIHTSTVATNPTGEFPSLFKDMTPGQRAAMQGYVDRGYDLFTRRCAEGRNMPLDSLKAIAEGRVWDGETALRLGLVDHLGGLDRALSSMQKSLGSDNFEVVEYPDVDFDFWKEMRKSLTGMKAAVMRGKMGELYPLYEAAQSISNMAPLQCRMEITVIE